jgi:penicillin-binding protein 1C
VATLEKVGVEKFFQLLDVTGLTPLQSAQAAGLSAALGASEVLPLELARSYAVLARQGRSVELCYFEPCTGTAGQQVMDKDLTLEITDVLADPIARIDAFGEGSALDLPFAVAVKTGTSRNFRDNYAVGFSSGFTVLVWVGNSDGSPMQEISGVTGAGPIFHDLMVMLNDFRPGKPFARPSPRPAPRAAVEALRVLSPQPGTIFAIDPDRPADTQKIRFESNLEADFFINGVFVGSGKQQLWIPAPGKYRLEARATGMPAAVSDFVVR